MATEVQLIAATIVLFRRQCEAERPWLVIIGAFTGAAGVNALRRGFDGDWVNCAVNAVLCVIAAVLWEWRWSKAMRIPGPDQ